MKRLLIFSTFLILTALVRAADPVAVVSGRPESRYDYTNGTISASSFTVLTVAAVNGYRQLKLTCPNSFYYRIDDSTQTIATTGFPVAANATETIETNQTVTILMPPGTAASTIRYIDKRK